MQDLIDRLEAATEGSRELDGLIWKAITEHKIDKNWCGDSAIFVADHFLNEQNEHDVEWDMFCWIGQFPDHKVPHYTTSIDAALTLVPQGWRYGVDAKEGETSFAVLLRKSDWLYVEASAPLPALAICIAALKARKEIEDE